MRRWVAIVLVGLVATGCKSKSKSGAGKPGGGAAGPDVSAVLAQKQQLDGEEEELVNARGALQRERATVVEGRQKISDLRKEIDGARKPDPARVAELAEAEKAQSELEQAFLKKQDDIDAKLTSLLQKRSNLVDQATVVVSAGGGGGGGGDPTAALRAREVAAAAREEKVARREAEFAAREKDIAAREAELNKGCQGGGSTVIVQGGPVETPKGTKYNKKDVEPTYEKALKILSQKGILDSDLPPGVANLKDDTRKAMEAGDYGKAKYTADQLLAVANGLKVDRGFLSAKFARVSARMKGKTLSSEGKSLFEEATENYGDGKFPSANSKLNKIIAMLK